MVVPSELQVSVENACGVLDGVVVVGDYRGGAGTQRAVDGVRVCIGVDRRAVTPLQSRSDLEGVGVGGLIKRRHCRSCPRYDIAAGIEFDHARERHVNGEVGVEVLVLRRIHRLDVDGIGVDGHSQDLLRVRQFVGAAGARSTAGRHNYCQRADHDHQPRPCEFA